MNGMRAWPALLAISGAATFATAQGMPWSTLLGGEGRDAGTAVAVDDRGLVTIAGVTDSLGWPYAARTGSGLAAFVARLDPTQCGATQLIWCTLLDRAGDDLAFDLMMTPDGRSSTVVGLTTSASLPVTANAYQPVLRGAADGFVLQLDGAGGISYCSYLGGYGVDWIHAVDRDAAGRLVLAGSTTSPSFPTTAGAYDGTFNGMQDTFVAILDPTLAGPAQLAASTFLGGRDVENLAFNLIRGPDLGLADVRVAEDGTIVVAGHTWSPDFPVKTGAFQAGHAGNEDMHVTRLDGALTALMYSTFLGAAGTDIGCKLALRGSLDVFLAGWTSSPGTTFPTTAGAPQRQNAGGNDAVLVCLRTACQGQADLQYATLLGGCGTDMFHDLAVEDSGVITTIGASAGGLTGTPGAFQPSSSPEDALIVRLDPRGNGPAGLHYVSFLSADWATWGERPFAMTLHGDGLITFVGFENTHPSFPTTRCALQAVNNGQIDAFVVQFDPLPSRAQRVGVSSPACRGPVSVQVNSNPSPGNSSFALLGNGAPRRAPGALALGSALFNPPVPYLGMTLFVNPLVVVSAVADGDGAWRLPLPLPAHLPFPPSTFLQWTWLNAPTCPGGPLSASHALGM